MSGVERGAERAISTSPSHPVHSTQQDPIGIAGGANVYGFASGDPVNFSDPFGLCPVCISAVTRIPFPYSTGGDLTKLSGSSLNSLIAFGIKTGHRFGISATTEGDHQDMRHNGTNAKSGKSNAALSGHAVDINEIDGRDIGTFGVATETSMMLLANRIATSAIAESDVKSVIWPTGQVSAGAFGEAKSAVNSFASHKATWKSHQSHFHITFWTSDEKKPK